MWAQCLSRGWSFTTVSWHFLRAAVWEPLPEAGAGGGQSCDNARTAFTSAPANVARMSKAFLAQVFFLLADGVGLRRCVLVTGLEGHLLFFRWTSFKIPWELLFWKSVASPQGCFLPWLLLIQNWNYTSQEDLVVFFGWLVLAAFFFLFKSPFWSSLSVYSLLEQLDFVLIPKSQAGL